MGMFLLFMIEQFINKYFSLSKDRSQNDDYLFNIYNTFLFYCS